MTPDQLAARLALAELELEAKGHSPKDSRSAVRRSAGWARSLSEQVRPELQEAVFEDLLTQQLARADDYVTGVELARARGDYAEGMQRGIRDNRFGRGMERLLGVPTSRDGVYNASIEKAAGNW